MGEGRRQEIEREKLVRAGINDTAGGSQGVEEGVVVTKMGRRGGIFASKRRMGRVGSLPHLAMKKEKEIIERQYEVD